MSYFASFRRPRTRRFLRVFAVIWLVVLVLMIGLYGWFTWNQAANGVEADGIVVQRTEDDAGDPTVYVRYTTDEGRPVRAMLTGTVSSGKPRFDEDLHVGDAVRIRYVPDDPALVRPAEEPAVEPTAFYYFGFFLLLGIGMATFAWWPGVSRGRRGA